MIASAVDPRTRGDLAATGPTACNVIVLLLAFHIGLACIFLASPSPYAFEDQRRVGYPWPYKVTSLEHAQVKENWFGGILILDLAASAVGGLFVTLPVLVWLRRRRWERDGSRNGVGPYIGPMDGCLVGLAIVTLWTGTDFILSMDEAPSASSFVLQDALIHAAVLCSGGALMGTIAYFAFFRSALETRHAS